MKGHRIAFVWVLAIMIGAAAAFVLSQDGQPVQDVKPKIKQIISNHTKKKPKKNNHRTIDFDTLCQQNPDIIAWIEIPGTDIDYPVMQSAGNEEEDYYLHHDFDRNYSSHGAIYMQKRNQPDFSDFDTILYGHNMNDGSMFKQLHLFEDPDFFARHKKIKIYLPERTLTYRVFATVIAGNTLILDDWSDYEDAPSRQKRINDIRTNGGNQREKTKVTAKDKILTLSTCTGDSDYRLLVVGQLSKTKEVKKHTNTGGSHE